MENWIFEVLNRFLFQISSVHRHSSLFSISRWLCFGNICSDRRKPFARRKVMATRPRGRLTEGRQKELQEIFGGCCPVWTQWEASARRGKSNLGSSASYGFRQLRAEVKGHPPLGQSPGSSILSSHKTTSPLELSTLWGPAILLQQAGWREKSAFDRLMFVTWLWPCREELFFLLMQILIRLCNCLQLLLSGKNLFRPFSCFRFLRFIELLTYFWVLCNCVFVWLQGRQNVACTCVGGWLYCVCARVSGR